MEQKKEAVYLINDERYLHLRENGAGVGFATYNKVTGEPLESGQISEKNLPPDGRNTIPAARNWYLFELSDDDRKAIQQESVKILENIPQAGIGRRRIWEPETLPKDIRLINSPYDDLYRIPDGGVIQVDYPDGRSFTARVEHLDDYHSWNETMQTSTLKFRHRTSRPHGNWGAKVILPSSPVRMDGTTPFTTAIFP